MTTAIGGGFLSRNKYIWIKIEYTKNTEEDLPMDVIAAIQENITNWGQTAINVGVDFIYQKLFRPVYNVPGIGYADIKVAVTDDLTTPLEDAYVSDNITIEEVEIAVIDKSRIVVQEIAP